jgi:hypothetical protein
MILSLLNEIDLKLVYINFKLVNSSYIYIYIYI